MKKTKKMMNGGRTAMMPRRAMSPSAAGGAGRGAPTRMKKGGKAKKMMCGGKARKK